MESYIMYTAAPPSETHLIVEGTKYLTQTPAVTILFCNPLDFYKVEIPIGIQDDDYQLGLWLKNGFEAYPEHAIQTWDSQGEVEWYE